MRHWTYILSIISLFGGTSCAPEKSDDAGDSEHLFSEISASIHSDIDFNSSKLNWNSNDVIGLVFPEAEKISEYSIINGAGSSNGVFVSKELKSKEEDIIAVFPVDEGVVLDTENLYYPLASKQRYIKDNIDRHLLPMIAYGTGATGLIFSSSVGILRFKLSHYEKYDLNRIVLTANSGETLAGEIVNKRIKATDASINVKNPLSSIEMIFDEPVDLAVSPAYINVAVIADSDIESLGIEFESIQDRGYKIEKRNVNIRRGTVTDLGEIVLSDYISLDDSLIRVIPDDSGIPVLLSELSGFSKKLKFCRTTSTVTRQMILDACSKVADKSTHIDIDLGAVDYESSDWPKFAEFESSFRFGELILPQNILTIKNNAFYKVPFDKITLNEKLTTIENITFYQTGADYEIYIPKNVASIGIANFNDAKNIVVDKDNAVYMSENGAVFNKSKTELLCYAGKGGSKKYIVPESAVTIYNYAFEGAELEEIVFPPKLKMFANRALQNCPYLYSITFLADSPHTTNPHDVSLYNFPGYKVDVNVHQRIIHVPAGRIEAYTTFLSKFVAGKNGVTWKIDDGVEEGGGNAATIPGLEEDIIPTF